MAAGHVEIDVPAPPDKVWALVGDYGGVASWFPGLDAVRLEGEDRVITAGSNEIRERLYDNDDVAHVQRYGVVAGMGGLTHHEATLAVADRGDGSHVTWSYEVTPDDMAPIMSAVYGRALEAIRDHFA